MCGIVGIVGHTNVNQSLYDALTVLQHRGQESAGMAVSNFEDVMVVKEMGLVSNVFYDRPLTSTPGDIAIVELDVEAKEFTAKISDALLLTFPNIKSVFEKVGMVSGDFRVPKLEHMGGENRTETLHKESGCRFRVSLV